MAAFAILAFLSGAVLAFRFRVFVLYPIIAVGALLGFVTGLAAGNSFWAVTLGVVTGAMALQAGYVFGTVGRMSLLAAHVAARRNRRALRARPTQII